MTLIRDTVTFTEKHNYSKTRKTSSTRRTIHAVLVEGTPCPSGYKSGAKSMLKGPPVQVLDSGGGAVLVPKGLVGRESPVQVPGLVSGKGSPSPKLRGMGTPPPPMWTDKLRSTLPSLTLRVWAVITAENCRIRFRLQRILPKTKITMRSFLRN